VTTKAKISKIISNELEIPHKISLKFLDSFLDSLKSHSLNKIVKLSGFGTFMIHKSPQRIGRNPKTKESYIIKPRNKIIYKPSQKIKEILN
tara:strand:- start:239 stop:511 length:273 start_codon:yes stop_codon:yes gene_type:complete